MVLTGEHTLAGDRSSELLAEKYANSYKHGNASLKQILYRNNRSPKLHKKGVPNPHITSTTEEREYL